VHRNRTSRYVLLPIAGTVAFLLMVPLVGAKRHGWIFSENGPVEMGTAFCFAAAAVVALRLYFAGRYVVPSPYRYLFLLFAMAATFVSLEELSYGQHIFGWKPPKFFDEHSSKHEVNLHNLYGDSLSNFLRLVANAAFPLSCVFIPIAAQFRRGYFLLGHWSFYLLPQYELISIALISQGVPPIDRFFKSIGVGSIFVKAGEVQELGWSIAALMYVCVIYQRVCGVATTPDVLVFPQFRDDSAELRKAA
jgi:hypothetical protein